MALDRFVYWQTEERPTREQLQHVLEDYLGSAEAGTLIWDIDRFFILLPGRKSEAFRRAPVSEVMRNYAEELLKATHDSKSYDITRAIEVWMRDEPMECEATEDDPGHRDFGCVDVMTRSADDFTNGVAARLAELLARFWNGKVQAG